MSTIIEQRKVYVVGNRLVIHVANGRGEELRLHLASHGLDSAVSPAAETDFERVEIQGDLGAEIIQAIVDQWE